MRQAESVTFGGSGLDRAGHLRGDAAAVASLLAAGRVLALWRGKPLLAGEDALGWLAPDHPALAIAGPAVFLGRDETGQGLFARDLSAWVPPEGTDLPQPGFFDKTRQPHPDLPPTHAFAELRGVMTGLSAREAELAATARAVLMWHRSHGFCAQCGAASDMVQAGWQRSCPACGTQHFPRTDPVVIMLVERAGKCLLGRSPRFPPGMVSCLAGFMEPGETIEDAVRRETAEEAGITVGRVAYFASEPWPFPMSLMIGVRGEALDAEIRIDEVELEMCRWFDRAEVAQLIAGTHPEGWTAPPSIAIAHHLIRSFLDTIEK